MKVTTLFAALLLPGAALAQSAMGGNTYSDENLGETSLR